MDRRPYLHERLVEILGTRNVYFQPPESVKMKYPAIRYSLRSIDINYASNGIHKGSPSYEVVLIDKNPDSEYVMKLLQLPYCRFDRSYAADNLNHFIFTIYNLEGGQ